MKFYSFGCKHCNGNSPMIRFDKKGRESIQVFSSRLLAEIEAADHEKKHGSYPLIIEVEAKRINRKSAPKTKVRSKKP